MVLIPPSSHVLITGASSGLGAALAIRYAAPGRRLSLFGRDRVRLDEVAEACNHRGSVADRYVCDVCDAGAIAHFLKAADDQAPVDLLFANAGIGGASSLTANTEDPLAQAHDLMETNVLGMLNTIVPLLPNFMARRHGHIVLIGSIAGLVGLPQSPAYCASKAAVHVYGEGLRRMLGPFGVGVTVVCPGFVDTPMSASLPTPRPFLWSADRAAAHIARAVAQRRRRLVFPWQLRWAASLAAILPSAVVDRLMPTTEWNAP